jgi:hypothetical protein
MIPIWLLLVTLCSPTDCKYDNGGYYVTHAHCGRAGLASQDERAQPKFRCVRRWGYVR